MKKVDDSGVQIENAEATPTGKKVRDSQNKQSVSRRRHPCHGPDLFLLFVFVSEDTVIFFRQRNGRSMSDEVHSVRRGIISANATYKINAVVLR